MEPFTNGKVSPAARRATIATHPNLADSFRPIRHGYMMYAWASQIRFARARGRGDHAGRGKPIHRFDVQTRT